MMKKREKILLTILVMLLTLQLWQPMDAKAAYVSANVKVVDVSVYSQRSAAITDDGYLWIWGDKIHQSSGGSEGNYIPVRFMENVKSVCLGDTYSLAIKTDSTMWAWGVPSYIAKDFGVDAPEDQLTPIQVMDGVKSVYFESNFGAVIKEDDSFWMWGDNRHYQLGRKNTLKHSTPIQLEEIGKVKSVSLGRYHSTVIKEDDSLWNWGYDIYGQLGSGGSYANDGFLPRKRMDNVSSISVKESSNAVIKEDGSVWTWGLNASSQLGYENTSGLQFNATPKQVDNLGKINSFSVGASHSAVIKEDKSLWMLGGNSYGQLGDGTTNNSSEPINVMANVEKVDLGYSTSAAIKEDGSLWMWGRNNCGQLGDNSNVNRNEPVRVEFLDWKEDTEESEKFDYIKDTWNFENIDNKIDDSALKIIPLSKRLLLEAMEGKDHGTEGQCTGMVLTVAAAYKGYPSLAGYRFSSISEILNLDDVPKNIQNAETTKTPVQMIGLGQIYNKSKKFEKEKKANTNQYQELYNAVKKFENNNDTPVVITMDIYQNAGWFEAGHCILGICVEEETDDMAKILVYDCNFPNQKRYIYLTKNASGTFDAWNYDSGHSKYGTLRGSVGDDSFLNYWTKWHVELSYLTNVVDDFISDSKVWCKDNADQLLLKSVEVPNIMSIEDISTVTFNFDKAKEKLSDYKASTSDKNIGLYASEYISLNTEANPASSYVFWVDNENPEISWTDLSQNSQISWTDNTSTINASVSEQSNISINTEEQKVEVDTAKGANFAIDFNVPVSDTQIEKVTVNGTSEGDTTVNCDDNNTILKGIEKVTITVTDENIADDGTAASQNKKTITVPKMNKDSSYQVKTDKNNNITILQDSNNDGSFDKEIATTNPTKTVVQPKPSIQLRKIANVTGSTNTKKKTLKLTWDKIPNASKYRVTYKINNGKDISLVVAGNSATLKKLKTNSAVAVKVQPMRLESGKYVYGTYSKIYYFLQNQLVQKKATAKKKALTAKWTPTKLVTGYQISYATNKKFTKAKTKTLKSAKKKQLVIKGLKSKKTYYVRIRAYKKYKGKTYYGKWSTIQKAKVK